MNIIERAGRQIGLKSAKSMVERAADRFAAAEPTKETPAPVVGTEASHQEAPHRFAKPGRETRHQTTIDFERLRRMGFALPGDQSSIAEEVRLIKRPLLETALSPTRAPLKNANVIMVTSASAHEGKTFVATNLALSMASEHDLHVLLIDGDFPGPSLPEVLGFTAEVGLIDVLSEPEIDLADVMIRTNIENLTLLPSGPTRPGSSELLASTRMARFVDDISSRYPDRVIIFDSPPVLVRSEPMVLAKHVGQVVFVIEAERTSRAAIEEAIGLIGPDRIGGVVLNKAPSIAQEQFGRYYGRDGR